MITIKQNEERTLQRAKLCEENGAFVSEIRLSGTSLFIIVVDDTDSFGFRRITYFSTIDWGGDGVLNIDFHEDGTTSLRWSHGGHCDDVTSIDIARVMGEIWRDVLEILSTGKTD